mmetsp:Transcript_34536/g.72736  ORF Transcript_34536/g.72736 Transcript_34536/m.72736 type:complete len:248 (-) Transcript_34536:369-1112(-)
MLIEFILHPDPSFIIAAIEALAVTVTITINCFANGKKVVNLVHYKIILDRIKLISIVKGNIVETNWTVRTTEFTFPAAADNTRMPRGGRGPVVILPPRRVHFGSDFQQRLEIAFQVLLPRDDHALVDSAEFVAVVEHHVVEQGRRRRRRRRIRPSAASPLLLHDLPVRFDDPRVIVRRSLRFGLQPRRVNSLARSQCIPRFRFPSGDDPQGSSRQQFHRRCFRGRRLFDVFLSRGPPPPVDDIRVCS